MPFNEFFDATSIVVGRCKSPNCRAVHIQLMDADETVRAQGVIACEGIDQLAANLKTVRDDILRGRASVARH